MIDEKNINLGTLETYRAQKLAEERGFDLVEVNPKGSPPVCKILDFGAYQYQQEKQERKQKAHQKKIDVKCIRLTLAIGKHDIEVRQKQAEKFLAEGHKVKIEIMLHGREITHQDLGRQIIFQFIKDLGENIIMEQMLTRQGRKFFTVICRKS